MGWTTTDSTSANTSSFGGFAVSGTIYLRFGPIAPPRPRPPPEPAFHPCAILGIPCKAPVEQVRSAYRRLAKAHHPDIGLAGEREERTHRMAELNRAYAMLKEG